MRYLVECGEKGCSEEPIVCRTTNETEFFCTIHAVENGFCICCGNFSAGLESFDFSPIEGFCEECVSQIRADAGEDENGEFIEDEDYGGYDPLPDEAFMIPVGLVSVNTEDEEKS